MAYLQINYTGRKFLFPPPIFFLTQKKNYIKKIRKIFSKFLSEKINLRGGKINHNIRNGEVQSIEV
jgi:hypothetical protein